MYAIRRKLVGDIPGAVQAKALVTAKNASKPEETYDAIRSTLFNIDETAWFDTPSISTGGVSTRLFIGIHFESYQGHRVVDRVIPGSAAEKAGVKVGDTILEINGQPVPTDGLLYPAGSTRLTLKIRRVDTDAPIQFEIELAATNFNSLLPSARKLEGRIGYLDLPTTSDYEALPDGSSYADQAHAAIKLADEPAACGWVLDLRRNSDGMNQGFAALGAFVDDGLLTSTKGPNIDRRMTYKAGGIYINDLRTFQVKEPYRIKNPNAPMAVLISDQTIWSGEAFALMLRARVNARLFGKATAGNTFLWNTFNLSDGASMGFKVGDMIDPNGKNVGGQAITPDQRVPNDPTLYQNPRDPVLKAALEWLKTQVSCQ